MVEFIEDNVGLIVLLSIFLLALGSLIRDNMGILTNSVVDVIEPGDIVQIAVAVSAEQDAIIALDDNGQLWERHYINTRVQFAIDERDKPIYRYDTYTSWKPIVVSTVPLLHRLGNETTHGVKARVPDRVADKDIMKI